jgi:hypothetical protein
MYRISVLFELGYGVNDMLGDAFATPSKSVMPRFVSMSADRAEIAIGVLQARRDAQPSTISRARPTTTMTLRPSAAAPAQPRPRTAIVPPAIHAERNANLSFIDISLRN